MEQMFWKKIESFRLFTLTAVLFYMFVLGCFSAYSQEQVRLPLTKFNTPGIVTLSDNNEAYSLHIPTPERWNIEEATLELAYVNSTALLASRSRLVILFNEYPLGQVTLEPAAPEGLVTVAIPGRLFVTGYNELKIQVMQDIKDEGCIPSNPPEAWTTLEFINSTLELSYTAKEVPLSLSSVAGFLFDPKMSGEHYVHIVTEAMDSANISLAAVTAAAVTLRFDYRSVQFSTGHELLPGKDNIIIGTHSFLRETISSGELKGDMGILPMPAQDGQLDRFHGLIYLGGSGPKEIQKSVTAFSVLSLPLPDIQLCQITDIQLPVISPYSGKNRLAPGKGYSFQELGFATTTFRGNRSKPEMLEFTLPTNFLLEGNRDIVLRLDFSYGAAMRNDSVLSLDVNGKFVASIPLDQPGGGQYRGYTVRLPLSYLSSGRNVLHLDSILTPLHTTACEILQTGQLALTLFETSTIQVPKLLEWVKLPQLSYLFNDGFPLTGMPDFSQSTLLLPQKDRKSMAAALNFIAAISQKTGVLPYGLTVTSNVSETGNKNILVIAARTDIPEEIIGASPFAQGISMPVHGRLLGTLSVDNWKDRLREWLFDEVTDFNTVTPDIAILGTEFRIRQQQAVLAEFESPFTPMKTVVLLTAEDSGNLLQASLLLQEDEVTQQCRDGFVVIDFNGKKPVIQRAALTPSYSVGEITVRNRISYFTEKFRWPFVALVVGLLIVLSLFLTISLKRRRARRQRIGLGDGDAE